MLNLIDSLSDEEVEILDQLSKLQKGEITEDDIDVESVISFSQKFNNEMSSTLRKYQGK